ncbi:MAG: DNA adenine methylase [Acidobacteria bacterium]|nr:DNA adenine methylase [Acidobacteriota bacterium]
MPVTDSPLRYPGGKSQLAPLVIDILRSNRLLYGIYVEPFAGGSGLALKLLLNSLVSEIYINDIDRSIYALWHSVLNSTDELCARVGKAKVHITEWRRQRAVQDARYSTLLDLGFSTLFMNRTNHSGIIRGGVIGGFDQNGPYKIDCRFRKGELIRKIERISKYKPGIHLSRMDALQFLTKVVAKKVQGPALVNLDPPYIRKGPELYQNHYTMDDHARLAKAVRGIKQYWMVTYDDTPEARALYVDFPSFTQELKYTAQIKRVGVELLVLDPRLDLPRSLSQVQRLAACKGKARGEGRRDL